VWLHETFEYEKRRTHVESDHWLWKETWICEKIPICVTDTYTCAKRSIYLIKDLDAWRNLVYVTVQYASRFMNLAARNSMSQLTSTLWITLQHTAQNERERERERERETEREREKKKRKDRGKREKEGQKEREKRKERETARKRERERKNASDTERERERPASGASDILSDATPVFATLRPYIVEYINIFNICMYMCIYPYNVYIPSM